MYEYYFNSYSLRQFKKLPRNVQRRLLNKLDFYCRDDPLKYADFLIDFRLGNFRFRIGEYRVIFDREEKNIILILLVGHRKDIYRKR